MKEAKLLRPDRRSQRTRGAVFNALRGLMFGRRYDTIRTGDLIDAAGVGRSTFYEHFRSKDEALVAMIDPIFVPLARAAAGQGTKDALIETLEHIWARRSAARLLFEPPLLDKLQRKLALLTEARMSPRPEGAPAMLVATGAACAQLAMLRMWLIGEVSCAPPVFAEWLMESGVRRR